MRYGQDDFGLLSDIEILRRIVSSDCTSAIFISPLVDPVNQINSSSIDLHLGREFKAAHSFNTTHLPLKNIDKLRTKLQKYMPDKVLSEGENFVLHPGEFILGGSLEFICLPKTIAGRLEGRSSLGRLGLQVHATAGFVDPGFRGSLTFELSNCGRLPLELPAGIRIGQISFFAIREVQVGYSERKRSKYTGQQQPDILPRDEKD